MDVGNCLIDGNRHAFIIVVLYWNKSLQAPSVHSHKLFPGLICMSLLCYYVHSCLLYYRLQYVTYKSFVCAFMEAALNQVSI